MAVRYRVTIELVAREEAVGRAEPGGVPLDERGQLRAALLETLRSESYGPVRLPKATLELLALARDPDVEVDRVRRLLETEPVLAGEVLAIARSAFYSRGSPIETIGEAVTRLGLSRLAELFLEASLKSTLFRSKKYAGWMEELRRHSTAAAIACRGICQQLGKPSERVFLAGLLHDIGIGASLSVLESVPQAAMAPRELLAEVVLSVHEIATDALGKRWDLPAGALWVASHHHDPHVGGGFRPMQGMVALADWIAADVGCSMMGEGDEQVARYSAEQLGLSSRQVMRVVGETARAIEELGWLAGNRRA